MYSICYTRGRSYAITTVLQKEFKKGPMIQKMDCWRSIKPWSRNVILYQGDLKWTQAKESEKGLIKIFFNTSIMAQKRYPTLQQFAVSNGMVRNNPTNALHWFIYTVN